MDILELKSSTIITSCKVVWTLKKYITSFGLMIEWGALLLHESYLPFEESELASHFLGFKGDEASADLYTKFYRNLVQKYPEQVAISERFWVASSLMRLFHDGKHCTRTSQD